MSPGIRERTIAEVACRKYSGRVGRSAAAKQLDENAVRLAVIAQQIYYRYYHGQTRDERFKRFGLQVQLLGNHCRTLTGA